MALYPDIPFNSGDVVTPELFYLAFHPTFDDQPQYLGHLAKLSDASLSDAGGQIKQRVAALEGNCKVTVATGLNLQIGSGVLRYTTGDVFTVASQLITAPNNSTSYVYVDTNGSIFCDSSPNSIRILLAKVVTSAGAVTTLTDLRYPGIPEIKPVASNIKSFGGNSIIDEIATQGKLYDGGIYYFRNFTVPSGITITVPNSVKIYCSGKVQIDGTVNVSGQTAGAPGSGNFVNAYSSTGGIPGQGLGGGGNGYGWGVQGFGSGGSGSNMWSDTSFMGYQAPGGTGGGAFVIEAAGSVTVTGSIIAKGGDGSIGSTSPIASGGYNIGVISGRGLVTGSSAGSGGLIALSSPISVTCTSTSILDVRGGAGGTGLAHSGLNVMAGGGTGGTGGFIVLFSPNVNTTGSTLLLTGGLGGVPGGYTTQVNSNTWTGGGYIAAAPGGAFGGNSISGNITVAGSVYTYTRVNSGSGQLNVRAYIPLG